MQPRKPRAPREVPTCIYCQQRAATTRDHVPPKVLFAEPRPSNLVTVPSCRPCNEGAASDEEYFVALLHWSPAGETPEGERIWPKLERAYTREREGLKRAFGFGGAFHEIIIAGPNGVEPRLAVEIDHPRVERVLEKVVRGLYWVEYGEPIGVPDVAVRVAFFPNHNPLPEDWGFDLNVGKGRWPGVFEYRFNRVARGRARARAMFELVFYDMIHAVATTCERSATDADVPAG
jgi:hypothetical protein